MWISCNASSLLNGIQPGIVEPTELFFDPVCGSRGDERTLEPSNRPRG